MGDVNGLMNKALRIPDHSTRLAARWTSRGAMLIPSPMPFGSWPSQSLGVMLNSLDAMRKGTDRAHRRGPWALGGHLDSTP